MGRRFTAASSEWITIGSAGLAGFGFTFGTVAALIYRATDTGTWEAMVTTNTAALEWDISSVDVLAWYDGTNERTGMTVPTGTPLVLASTKATGTATARMHMYRFDTNTWTHQAASGTNVNSAATTAMGLGAYSGGDFLSAEMWAVGMWPGRAWTDSEVKRLAGGRWLNYSPGFYEQFTDGREVGDMVRTIGRHGVKQTARVGTTRGVVKPPAGFAFGPVRRRR